MAHLASFKSTGAVGVLRHDERKETDKVQSRKNECIDNSRTHLNYNLASPRKGTLMEHIRRVCSENQVHLNKRKDLNVMCSWVVTAPKSITSAEQLLKFFRCCYDFMTNRYGKKYTLSATVHLDETTPHLHYSFLPVGYDKKNERYTVSSKLVATRTELRNFQRELSKALEKEFGYDVGILNEATKDGNKEIQELKLQTAKKRIAEAEQFAEQAEKRLNDLQGRVLKQEEVNALQGKKTLTGGLKGISYSEYLSLKKTAQNVNNAKVVINKLREENKRLTESIGELKVQLQNANAVTESKENIIQNRIERDLQAQYEKYIYRKIPKTPHIGRIKKTVCCVISESDNAYIIKCPASEVGLLDRMLKQILPSKNNNFHL